MKLTAILLLSAFTRAAALSLEPIDFEAADGQVVAAEQGRFEVPVHHDDPDGPKMTLSFVRFPATVENPGPPIVYLAGGPGGSGIGTARGGRFPLFMALREYGDVIAFDQRGTGESGRPPTCRAESPFAATKPFSRELYLEYAIAAAKRCEEWWAEAGVDLSAYNTLESAGDLEALRRHLGADKLTLWGISYGTHLAMAAIKRMGDERIHRAILASPEGLDQTVKLPARWDGYLERLAEQVKADPKAAHVFPDTVGTLRAVLDRLEREPAKAMLTTGDGDPVEVSFGPVAVRYILAFAGKNPQSASRIPALIYGLAAGHYQPVIDAVGRGIFLETASYSAMSLGMDMSSGISPARLQTVRRQAKTALMGDVLNYPLPHFLGQLDIPDLGEEFRSPLESHVPALVLTGTLDGRTFPEAHAEVLAQFADGHQLVIDNAGHDLFMVSPEVTDAILTFMKGEKPPERLAVDPPQFAVPE